MRRHLLAAGLGALALAMAPALALGQQQSNDAGALAGGSNGAIVAQQATGGPGGAVSQSGTATQVAPVAVAPAVSAQVAPVNVNLPVRVASPGDEGQVSQSNDSAARAQADNAAVVEQDAAAQGGSKKGSGGGSVAQSGSATQVAPVAVAPAVSAQVAPVNVNAPVRVLSEGDSGEVDQQNSSSARAGVSNEAVVAQRASAGHGGAVSQSGSATQVLPVAIAPAISAQVAPVNLNAPVRVLSPGDAGSVSQSNDSAARARAGNGALVLQSAGERKKGAGSSGAVSQSGSATQVLPVALAPAIGAQLAPVNLNAPVSVGLPKLPLGPGAVLADPVGAVLGIVGSLPLPALPVDPFAVLADPVGAVTGLVGSLPLPALPVGLL